MNEQSNDDETPGDHLGLEDISMDIFKDDEGGDVNIDENGDLDGDLDGGDLVDSLEEMQSKDGDNKAEDTENDILQGEILDFSIYEGQEANQAFTSTSSGEIASTNSSKKKRKRVKFDSKDTKRPRGRPPVASNSSNTAVSRGKGSSSKNFFPKSDDINFTAGGIPYHNQHPDSLDGQDSQKTLKLPPAILSHKILGKLMTDDPLSVMDLAKMIPEAAKDSIQAVLEVLQVMGIVIAVRCRDPNNSSSLYSFCLDYCQNNEADTGSAAEYQGLPSISTSSSNNSSTIFYTIAGFGKSIEPLDFRRLHESLEEKKAVIENLKNRVTVLNVSIFSFVCFI